MAARPPRWRCLVPTVLLAIMAGGCEQQVVYNSWSSFEKLAAGDRDRKPTNRDGRERRSGSGGKWAIHLSSFSGPDASRQAEALAKRVREKSSLTQVWVHEAPDRAIVYRGRYASADDPEAVNALRQTRMTKIDSKRPFEKSRIASIDAATKVVRGPHDLLQFPGMYTLQVEVYDDDIGPQFRDLAEQRTDVLRKDGDDAYFYHGPHRSMVCVGLFTARQAFVRQGTTDTYAPAVRALQRKHPHNLHNGGTVIERARGRNLGEQGSSLVHVPG